LAVVLVATSLLSSTTSAAAAAAACPPVRLLAVRVPLYPFADPARDYSEMARRYPHMYVAPDMMHVTFKWAQVGGGGR
jgi:hypothetical protein